MHLGGKLCSVYRVMDGVIHSPNGYFILINANCRSECLTKVICLQDRRLLGRLGFGYTFSALTEFVFPASGDTAQCLRQGTRSGFSQSHFSSCLLISVLSVRASLTHRLAKQGHRGQGERENPKEGEIAACKGGEEAEVMVEGGS